MSFLMLFFNIIKAEFVSFSNYVNILKIILNYKKFNVASTNILIIKYKRYLVILRCKKFNTICNI